MGSDMIEIHTDGACSGNPGPGGWGAIIVHPTETVELKGGEPHTTNQRMELMGVIKSLETIIEPNDIIIHTDSQYVQKGFMEWLSNWIKNGWVNSNKKPVANKDLWLALINASKIHHVKIVWVKGHNGNEMNERVNTLAQHESKHN